jgi:iron complex transport system ATP-binding protein
MVSQNTRTTNSNAHQLILEDVHLWRGKTSILKGINWQVKPGEHWAILGPNGSGKTSLIMAVSGYLPFGGGRIYLMDGWIGKINLPEHRKKIGIVSQAISEHIAVTIPQITASAVVLTGLFGSMWLVDEVTDEDREHALQILTELGVSDLADSQFSLLSTGERQACMLARSRMAQNELVLLDESCAGLDLGARERFLSSLGAMIRGDNCPTVVFITHHPEEIVSGITHVLLLRDGAVVAAGPKTEVLTSDSLSHTFGIPLRIATDNGRYWVQAAHS